MGRFCRLLPCFDEVRSQKFQKLCVSPYRVSCIACLFYRQARLFCRSVQLSEPGRCQWRMKGTFSERCGRCRRRAGVARCEGSGRGEVLTDTLMLTALHTDSYGRTQGVSGEEARPARTSGRRGPCARRARSQAITVILCAWYPNHRRKGPPDGSRSDS
jgi:hypothetical protein